MLELGFGGVFLLYKVAGTLKNIYTNVTTQDTTAKNVAGGVGAVVGALVGKEAAIPVTKFGLELFAQALFGNCASVGRYIYNGTLAPLLFGTVSTFTGTIFPFIGAEIVSAALPYIIGLITNKSNIANVAATELSAEDKAKIDAVLANLTEEQKKIVLKEIVNAATQAKNEAVVGQQPEQSNKPVLFSNPVAKAEIAEFGIEDDKGWFVANANAAKVAPSF